MSEDNVKRISKINDDFDLNLFLYITRKNILLVILLLIVAVSSAFIYLRYTPPLFQASAIIQIGGDESERFESVFPGRRFADDDMAKKIELMRSQVFLDRAFRKLPLEIEYFSKGQILDYELYGNSPFLVDVKVKCPSFYQTPIYIEFVNDNNIILSHNIGGQEKEIKIFEGEFFDIGKAAIRIDILNHEAISKQQSLFSKDSYFFIVNRPDRIVPKYSSDLSISVLSSAAKTIKITYEGHNARKTADIVNAIAEEFGLYEIERKSESARRTLDFIDKQIDVIFDKLSESEFKLRNFKKEHQIDETSPSQLPTIFDRINNFETQIVKLEMEKRLYKDVKNSLKDESKTDVYNLVAILSGSEFKGNVANMLNNLRELLHNRERLLYEVTTSSGQIESLDHQIDIQKNMIINSIATLERNIKTKIAEYKNQILIYEDYMLDHKYGSNYSMIEYSRLKRVHAINEQYYNELVTKKAQYSISKAGFVPQSAILEKANTPGRPVSPISRNVYIGSFLFALLLGSGIIVLRYLFFNEIASVQDIGKYTSAPILGIVPKYKKEVLENQLIVYRKPKSIISESLRSIRTNLQFIDNKKGSKLIAVTSTVSGEGKTFFSINLAGILAYSNKKVILIDSDMRKPKIHREFGEQNVKGLSTILSGIDKMENCIKKSYIDNFDYITGGPIPPNPSELIISEKMDEVVKNLKDNYDYVIIDTPPVGIVTDGMRPIMIADYPIHIFKAGFSKRMFINNLNNLVDKNNISKLSLVLNSVKSNFADYGYGRIYSYGRYEKYGYRQGYYDSEVPERSTWFKKVMQKLKIYKS